MCREEQDAGIVIESILRSVTVVVVPIDNQYFLVTMNLLRIFGRDGCIAVKAETFLTAGVVGVVPRWPHAAEDVAYFAPGDCIDCTKCSCYCQRGNWSRYLNLTDRVHVLGCMMGLDTGQGISDRSYRQ